MHLPPFNYNLVRSILLFCCLFIGITKGVGQPTANFTESVNVGCVPLTVQFTSTANYATSWYWDLGNGAVSYAEHPSAIYTTAGTYTIKLVVTDVNGNVDSIVQPNLIDVQPMPEASFGFTMLNVCENQNTVVFTNTSQFATTYMWDFDDGFTSTDSTVTHNYTNAGTYQASLVAFNGLGCSDVFVSTITIFPAPDLAWSVDTTATCDPNHVFQFTENSTLGQSFWWDFGDGTTSQLASPTHSYALPGNYTIKFAALCAANCTDTIVIPNAIQVNAPNPPNFSVDIDSGCPNLMVTFTDSTFGAANVAWDFGDNTTGSGIQTQHQYLNSGNYHVTADVTDSLGCISSLTVNNQITIFDLPTAQFSLSDSIGCSALTVNFTNTSMNASTAFWTFGDGGTSTLMNPSRNYDTPGSYTVILEVTNSDGCVDTTSFSSVEIIGTIPEFTADVLTGCNPITVNFSDSSNNAVQWTWLFGDGSTSTLQNPSHTYTAYGVYDVTLIIENAVGCIDTVVYPSYINVLDPGVSYTPAPPLFGCMPFTVNFQGSTVGTNSWSWDFGDGTTSNNPDVQHIYTTPGTYTVALTTYTAGGCITTIDSFATVVVMGSDATLSMQPIDCNSLSVSFADSSAYATSWLWNFGDGDTASVQYPTHNYANQGIYAVQLYNEVNGCESGNSSSTFVDFSWCDNGLGGFPMPPGDGSGQMTFNDTFLVGGPLQGCVPFLNHFVNPYGGMVSVFWDFGDGSTSTDVNPIHVYQSTGLFDITLVLVDTAGVTYTILFPQFVEVRGSVPQLQYNYSYTCDSMTVDLTTNAGPFTSWDWMFSDGDSAAIQNPSHTFPLNNTGYTAILQVEDTSGCPNTVAATIFTPFAEPNFTNPDTVCLHDSVQFSSALPASFSFLWDFGDGATSTAAEPMHPYHTTGVYQVTLEVIDTMGCTRFYALDPILAHGPHANFVAVGPTSGCIDFLANFEALYPNADYYHWEFASNSHDVGINADNLYTSVGVFDVMLTVGDFGCVAEITQTQLIQTFEAVADFTTVQSSDCYPMTVNFTDLSIGGVSWLWDFGDGTTSNLQNPVHLYTAAPSNDISLTMTDSNGCEATKTITGLIELQADFSVLSTQGCMPATVNFGDASINAITWNWDFGDGNTSTDQNPSNTYNAGGQYDVSLIVTSALGCIDTLVYPNLIHVIVPVAAFTETQTGTCAPKIVEFFDASIDATSWLWDFGDGATSTAQNPTHVYSTPGLYSVSLVVSTALGCSDTLLKTDLVNVMGPDATFTLSDTLGCEGLAVQFSTQNNNVSSWLWDFGDGFSSTDSVPSHTYGNIGTYTISLLVTDSNGCSSFTTQPDVVAIEALPTAAFTVSDTIGCPGLVIDFTDQLMNASSWTWELGDTTISNVSPLAHSYTQPGTYSVYIIAENQLGCADTSAVQNIVINPTFNATIVQPNPVCATDTLLQLSAADSGGTWNGTGIVDAAAGLFDPALAGAGNHQLSYTMTGDCGATDTIQIEVVAPVNAAITAQAPVCENEMAIQLTAVDSAGVWSGLGITDSIAGIFDPTVAGAGMHTVYYVISGTCSDSASIQLQIHPKPIADFTTANASGCAPLTATLTNQSTVQGGGVYSWFIDGVMTSNLQNPTFTFDSGIHNVELVVQNQFGCSDSLLLNNFINVNDTLPPPIVNLTHVTVHSNSEVFVAWEPLSVSDFQAYKLYRKAQTDSTFQLIATIADASISNFTDVGLTTLNTVYCYKIIASDSCAFARDLDEAVAHCTMNVETQLSGTNVLVHWSPYGGAAVAAYEVYRLSPLGLLPQHIGSTQVGQLEFLDTTAYCPIGYSYRIKATKLNGTQLYSMSDTAIQFVPGTMEQQQVEISRTTVVDDAAVLTEWSKPAYGASEVIGYRLYRAIDDGPFQLYEIVDSAVLSYMDYNVSVMAESYTYKIDALNTCEVEGLESNIGTSILLEKDILNEFQTKLNWTPYQQWDTGVEYYEIQKQREDGTWEIIKVVDGSVLETVIDN